MIDAQHYKAILEKRLAELDSRLHEVEGQLDAPHSNDWEEAAVEHEGDEVLEGLGNAGLIEAQKINAALKRIEDGEYGDCLKCGNEILPERLNIVPHATLCRICARQVEQAR